MLHMVLTVANPSFSGTLHLLADSLNEPDKKHIDSCVWLSTGLRFSALGDCVRMADQ